jgi:hypothetical protein
MALAGVWGGQHRRADHPTSYERSPSLLPHPTVRRKRDLGAASLGSRNCCVYSSEPRSRKASGLPDPPAARPMRQRGPCSLLGGGGPSALPRESARGCTPQTFGHSQTYGGSGGAERVRMILFKAGAGGRPLRRGPTTQAVGEELSYRSPGFDVIVGR